MGGPMAVSLSSPSDFEEIPVDEDAALDAPESCGVEYRAKQQRCRVCHPWIASGAWALEQHKAHCNNKTQRLPCPYCGKKVADNANARWQHSKHCQQQRNSDMAWRNSRRYRSERQHAPPMTRTRSRSEHESSCGISIRVSCKAACAANDTYKITICQEHESSFGISIRVSCKEHGQCWYRYTKGAVSHKERGQRSYCIRRVPSPIRSVATVFSGTQNVPSPTRRAA
eukprot:symbB.v1.2.033738.t1/scaffold4019.1/size63226/6